METIGWEAVGNDETVTVIRCQRREFVFHTLDFTAFVRGFGQADTD
jgi:hypothetical protein